VLAQRSVIGSQKALTIGAPSHLVKHVARKRLRRLCTPEPCPFDCLKNAAVFTDSLESVCLRQRRNCASSCPGGGNHSFHRFLEYERTRSIVNHNDARACRQVVKTAPNGPSPVRTADADQKSLNITLEKPGWRIAGVALGKYCYDHADVRSPLK
jgi:hypothetical protein